MRGKAASSAGAAALSRDPAGTHPAWVIVLASAWLGSLGNLALWQTLARMPELSNARGFALGIGMALLIACATAALLSLLAWRWTFKPVLLLLLLSAAVATHFMLTYHVVIDTTMLVNALQSNPNEVRDLLTLRLLVTVLLLAGLPGLWLIRHRVRSLGLFGQLSCNAAALMAATLLAAGLLWLTFQDLSSLVRSRTELRFMVNPLNALYAAGNLIVKTHGRRPGAPEPVGEDARAGASYQGQTRPPLLLLVVGETARSANFALNGYRRPTNPELARDDVASFRQVQACGTSTASALPCMFSHLGRDAFEARKSNYQNLLDVLQRAGLAVLWIDNQSGCKGICDRVASVNTSGLALEGLCAQGECLDEVMLRGLDQRIAALDAQRRAKGVVLVLHAMGSHGPAYFKRSPAQRKAFLPECGTSLLQSCSSEQLFNAYDNSILYADHVLHEAVQWLKAQAPRYSASLIYLSDHGESLGENNLYLHGLPYAIAPDEQTRVPLITWLSAEQQQRSRMRSACLKARTNEPLTHDHLFHSVLGLLDVQTGLYRRELDLFAPCVAR